MDPKKFLRQILTHKTKKSNMIVLKHKKSYHKKLYESNDAMDNIQPLFMEDKGFSLEDIYFWIKHLVNGKYKDIECYQDEILKIGG